MRPGSRYEARTGFVVKLAKYLAGPYCGEEAAVRMLDKCVVDGSPAFWPLVKKYTTVPCSVVLLRRVQGKGEDPLLSVAAVFLSLIRGEIQPMPSSSLWGRCFNSTRQRCLRNESALSMADSVVTAVPGCRDRKMVVIGVPRCCMSHDIISKACALGRPGRC